MVYHGLDAVFSALADPSRRRIVQRLHRREQSISELAAPFPMSLPAVSKHVRVLERAGLVSRRRDGRQWTCRLVTRPMQHAADWLEDYRTMWEQQLDRLALHLDLDSATEEAACPAPPATPRSISPASSAPHLSASSRPGRRRKR